MRGPGPGASLVRRGIAAPGTFDLGNDVDRANDELQGVHGKADNLVAVVQPRRGVPFESTPMPPETLVAA